MTEVGENQQTPLAVHKDAWGQKELLEGIVRRYLSIRSHVGGLWPTWEVESDELEAKFSELNDYLERLGWMARLRRGDVNQLTVLPLPYRQFPGSRIHFYMWTASLITLLLSAVRWMDNGRPTGGWFAESVYLDAMIGFAFPILFTLLIASFVQTRLSARFGVRSGHILPIPDPSVLLWLFSGLSTSYFIWPFGIFFIPTLPRMDARPWPDRKSLAWTSISVPLVLLISGFVLWTLGLIFTPDSYSLSGEPFRANPPFLIELISSIFDFTFQTTLDWGHPFFFAAGFLTLVGWLLLLPIPTFPGGRLLVARMGVEEARSSGTQILMFMLLITAAFFIFDAFNGFTIWIPVLSVAVPLLLFMGGDARIPVLMDGDRPLTEDNHRRLGIVLFVAILFAIPPQFPVEAVERWDDDATYILDADQYASLSDGWNASVMITIENPSMEDRDYDVSGKILGASIWTSEMSCGALRCTGVLEPGETKSFEFTIAHENLSFYPTFIDYQIDIEFDDATSHQETGSIYPDLNASVGSEWHHVRIDEEVLACLDIHVEDTFEANISFPELGPEWLPFMWLDGQAGLTAPLSSDDTTVCLDGVDKALPYTARSLLGTVEIGNASFTVGFDSTWPHIVSASDSGWIIDEHHPWGVPFDSNGTMYQENETFCVESNRGIPSGDKKENWTWDLSIEGDKKVPSMDEPIVENQRLLVKFEDDTYIFCNQDDYTSTKFTVQEGPDLVVYHNNEAFRLWDVPMTATTNQLEVVLYNSNAADVVLRHATFGDGAWDLSELPDTLSSGWNNVTLEVPSSLINTYQLTHQDGAILITFGAYLEAES